MNVGEKYGRLTAIKKLRAAKDRHLIWLFKCDCGNTTETKARYVRGGDTRSCGCLDREKRQRHAASLNLIHGMWKTNEFIIWGGMHQRCYNKKCKAYKNYGARGIAICKRWHEFKNFYADMGR